MVTHNNIRNQLRKHLLIFWVVLSLNMKNLICFYLQYWKQRPYSIEEKCFTILSWIEKWTRACIASNVVIVTFSMNTWITKDARKCLNLFKRKIEIFFRAYSPWINPWIKYSLIFNNVTNKVNSLLLQQLLQL